MLTFTYHWMHTPDNTGGTGILETTKCHALEIVNEWNRRGNGLWVYWLEV